MQNQIVISIGIPTYNNAGTIAETIASLKKQTFTNWECLICDDSETTETFDAAKVAISDDPRFTLVRNEVRLGAAENWNKTLNLASGKYFKLLCADDVIVPDALQIQWQALENYTDSVLCTGRRDIINASGKILIRSRGLRSKLQNISKESAARYFIKSGSNIFGEPSFALYRTRELRSTGGFDPNWSYLIDVVSYLKILQHGDLVAVNDTLGSFRISSTSWSANLSRQQRNETLKCLEYAAKLKYANSNRYELRLGKVRATISSFIRKLIFKFLA
jgi:glycosyltransferase involved in cell wall biosynthesis